MANQPVIDVSHVAKLANLTLTPEEEEKFATQLAAILDYISQLKEVDVSAVEPTSQVTGLTNVTRDDVEEACLPLKHGHYKVKAIFEND